MLSNWKHQEKAIRILHERPATLVWGGMGVGKTRIGIMNIVQDQPHRTLIVCPKAVQTVWCRQFQIHWPRKKSAPMLKVLNKGDSKTKARTIAITGTLDPVIFVINYESVWREPIIKALLTYSYDLIVCDEAHRLKSAGSKQSRAMHRLAKHAKKKVALSGTPFPQGPIDAYGIFRFLDDSIFGTRVAAFRERYLVMGGFEGREIIGYQNMDDFTQKIKPVVHKIDPDVLDLPETIDQTIPTPLDSYSEYRLLQTKYVLKLRDRTVIAQNKLALLLRLQQYTSGMIRTSDSLTTVGKQKMEAVKELITESYEPFVIFCRFTTDIEALIGVCESLNIKPLVQSGARKDYEAFIAGKSRILIGQIQATCEGLDLTHCGEWQCRRAIFYSLGFSLYQYEQARKRIHRPGQRETCYYYHLIAPETVDEKVMEAIEKKRDLVEWVAQSLGRTTYDI